jgi:hypothetical protein
MWLSCLGTAQRRLGDETGSVHDARHGCLGVEVVEVDERRWGRNSHFVATRQLDTACTRPERRSATPTTNDAARPGPDFAALACLTTFARSTATQPI